MKKQRILSILLSIAMMVSMLPSAFAMDAKTFNDVDENAWYYSYVESVYDDGFMTGTKADEFSPNTPMTRAMFVQALSKVAIKYVGEFSPELIERYESVIAIFKDVEPNAWYAKAVAWAKEAGITQGIEVDEFGPDLPITRQEISLMMVKFVDYLCEATSNAKQTVDQKDNTKKDSFTDAAAIADWAKAAVEQCRVWGLVAGYPDGEFKPVNDGTRAEIATIIASLDLFVEKIADPQPTEPTEDPTEPTTEEPTTEEPTTEEPTTEEPTTEEPTTEEPTTEEPTTEEPTTEEPTTEEPTTEEPTTEDPTEPVDYIYNALTGIIADVKADVKENGKLVLNKGEQLLGKTELDDKTINYIKNNDKLMAALGLAMNAAGELVDAAQNVVTIGDGYIYVGGSESYIALTGVNFGGPNAIGSTEHPIDVTYIVDLNTDSFVNLVTSSYVLSVENAAKLAALTGLVGSAADSINKQTIKNAADEAARVAQEAAKLVADEFEKATGREIPAETIKFVANRIANNAAFCKNYIDEHTAKEMAQVAADEFMKLAHKIPVETVKAAAKQIAATVKYRENHINVEAAKAAALEIAQTVAARFEGWMGVEIPVETVKAAAEKVLKASIAAASDAKDYADSYVKNLWVDNFKGENGYYTGDVKFIVNDTVVTVKVDDETYLSGSKKDAVIDLAVAIAKDLCFDLTSLKDWTSFTEIDPSVTVEVLFSAGAYAEDTDNYPYSYPVSFTLDIEGTVADNLMWKFNRGPFVKFIITERMQNAYDAMVKKATSPALLGALTTNTSGNIMISVMGNIVDAAIEEAMAPMADAMASVGVQPGGEAAVELAKPENEDTLRELINMYAPAEFASAKEMGLDGYAVAKAQDFLMTPPGAERVTVNADAARSELDATMNKLVPNCISDLFENPVVIKYLKKAPVLAEKLKLAQLSTFDKVADLKLGNLATAMRTETFQNVIARGERVDNIVDRVLDLVKFIPDEASVIINGKTVNEKTLAAIRDAENTVEACEAVADLIDIIGDATLSTFDGDGVKATVKYNDKSVNFGLALDI